MNSLEALPNKHFSFYLIIKIASVVFNEIAIGKNSRTELVNWPLSFK